MSGRMVTATWPPSRVSQGAVAKTEISRRKDTKSLAHMVGAPNM